MILELLSIGGVVKTFYSANKSLEMDSRALKKYGKAFEVAEEAKILIQKKESLADKRLANVVKKKRAIIKNTIPKFVNVYGVIQKVEINNKQILNEISFLNDNDKLESINNLTVYTKKNFSDKELVCSFITKGFAKMMEMDSERYLSAANNQLRAANVLYSQSESIGAIYDSIIARADRISNLLVAMNALFLRSINETASTIEKNGPNVQNYTDYDKGVLMTCANIACAISDIINVPVIDQNGNIYESATKMIEQGENYLSQIKNILNKY